MFSTRSTSTGKCCCETEGASGMFSAGEGRGASRLQHSVISLDKKKKYLTNKRTKEGGLTTLLLDIKNPYPNLQKKEFLLNQHLIICNAV